MRTTPRFAGFVFIWLFPAMIIHPLVMMPSVMCMVQERWGEVGDDHLVQSGRCLQQSVALTRIPSGRQIVVDVAQDARLRVEDHNSIFIRSLSYLNPCLLYLS